LKKVCFRVFLKAESVVSNGAQAKLLSSNTIDNRSTRDRDGRLRLVWFLWRPASVSSLIEDVVGDTQSSTIHALRVLVSSDSYVSACSVTCNV